MHVLVKYELEDFEQWKAAFDERTSVREAHGWQGGQVFTRADSDRNVVLLAEWDSADNARAYFDGADFRQAMQNAGVNRKPDVTLLEYVEDAEPFSTGDGDDTDAPNGESTAEDSDGDDPGE